MGAAHLLEGSVQQAGNLLRITAHLVRARDGSRLWSRKFDRPREDVFSIQDEIALEVVKALQAVVEGRLTRKGYGPYDIRPVRVAALAALARNGASNASLVAAINLHPADMATGTLADWLVAIEKTPGVRNAVALRTAAEAELRRRLDQPHGGIGRIVITIIAVGEEDMAAHLAAQRRVQLLHARLDQRVAGLEHHRLAPGRANRGR